MRVIFGVRNEGRIEWYNHISKFNYGSRKGYSINGVILKKWLIYDKSMRNMLLMVHIIIDLEVYYDRQLRNIANIAEESPKISKARVKLIVKVLPLF